MAQWGGSLISAGISVSVPDIMPVISFGADYDVSCFLSGTSDWTPTAVVVDSRHWCYTTPPQRSKDAFFHVAQSAAVVTGEVLFECRRWGRAGWLE